MTHHNAGDRFSMNSIHTVEGSLMASGDARFALVVGRWNSFVVESLLEGAVDFLRRHGIADSQLEIIRVPGAFELPLVCQRLAASGRYQALIALGAVIRGGTPHFEYGAGECSAGLARVAVNHGIPAGCGVLSVERRGEAIQRSRT